MVIGELGALKSVYGGDIVRAAYGMRDAQIATCRLGAQGWLYWTWDTHENLASQPLFFHLDEVRRGDQRPARADRAPRPLRVARSA